MQRCKVGVQLHPQATTIAQLRATAREIDAAGFASLWVWDHFFPLYGDAPDHFEAWTLLAMFAADTTRVELGTLVTSVGYRNPHLLADMARTVDHVSGGRAVLGIGAGWFRPDYDAYELPFPTTGARLRDLEVALYRIEARLAKLAPPAIGDLDILVGGGGEQVTLRIVAEHATRWNGFGPLETWAHKNRVLDAWCERLGRDPAEIERTALVSADEVAGRDDLDAWIEAGATHLILSCGPPFELGPARDLLASAWSR